MVEKRNKELGESCEKLLPTTYIINMTFKRKFIFATTTICIISLAYAGNYCVGQKIGKVIKNVCTLSNYRYSTVLK